MLVYLALNLINESLSIIIGTQLYNKLENNTLTTSIMNTTNRTIIWFNPKPSNKSKIAFVISNRISRYFLLSLLFEILILFVTIAAKHFTTQKYITNCTEILDNRMLIKIV